MSEESISYGEDKENLLYISKKINIDEFGLGEEGLSSVSPADSFQEIVVKPVGSEITILEEVKVQKCFTSPGLAPKFKPFSLSWSFGINAKTGLINLTTETRTQLFFSSVHTPILYDYCSKKMRHLEGHQAQITCLASDADGDWLVSSDDSKDGCLIVWDSKTSEPVYTIFNFYSESGIRLMAISPCARYLITIGENVESYHQIDMWLWTLGEDEPNDTYIVNQLTSGKPVEICFHPNIPEHIMLVFEKQVYLIVWDSKNKKFITPSIPNITNKNKIGHITRGTYLANCHECYASSSRGCILVFRTTLFSRSYEEGELSNEKIFINAVKVTTASIGVILETEGKLVVGDSRGHIFFFDKRIKILYWIKNFPFGAITDIRFAKQGKSYQFEESKVVIKKRPLDDDNYLLSNCDYLDMTDEIEKTVTVDAPFDASLDNNPFVVGDFFVSTSDCNIYAVDFLNNACSPLFQTADANISSIDTHDEKPYIVVAYENGRISLIDYEKKVQIAQYILPKSDNTNAEKITCLKYAVESLHLACGRNNGQLWVLDPINLVPKAGSPFKISINSIVKVVFSHTSLQMACYDANKTVFLFNYNPEGSCWEVKGKVRSHYEAITDIRFFYLNESKQSVLYTIGADRHLVEYNNLKIRDDGDEHFGITIRERIEQTAIPTTFTYYVKYCEDRVIGYILIADDNYKLKFLQETQKVPRAVVLGPSYGCFKGSPIKKMRMLPLQNFRYMVFACKKHIGIHILPADGNPYKYSGFLAHPVEIADFALSYNGVYAFTFGMEDRCILQWEVKPRAVDLLSVMGGTELEPFYCLLEGGKNGWLFREIQDLFFYMQILQQENIDLPRRVSDTINLSEIPDLVRACGYYPTEFELETLMFDIRYRDYDETGFVRDDISFVEFVKLFINHRPAYGHNVDKIKEKFNTVCQMADYPRSRKIDTHDFIFLLQTVGEPSPTLHKNLTTLLRISTYGENNFDFLPDEIDNSFLMSELLGIDPNRTEDQEYFSDSDSDNNRFP